MSVHHAIEFLAKVGEDQDLAAQLENINTAEEFIRFAQAQGYEISETDLDQARNIVESEELSEDQLEAVAGGEIFSLAGAAAVMGLIASTNELYQKNSTFRSTVNTGANYVKKGISKLKFW